MSGAHAACALVRAVRLFALTLLFLVGVPDVSGAQDATKSAHEKVPPTELARARQLFQRGVEFAAKGEYSAAAKRFRDALAIKPAPAIEYNLASALYELGSYQEAYNRTQSVLHDEAAPADVRTRAERLERALQPYVARLTVMSSGTAEVPLIRVDGTAVDPKLLGVTQAVPPGTHTIVSERAGGVISERQVKIPVRTAAIVDVSLIATPAEAAQTVATPAPEPELKAAPALGQEQDAQHPRRNLRIWASVGAAVVAVGVGVTVGVLMSRDNSSPQKPVAGSAGVLTWK